MRDSLLQVFLVPGNQKLIELRKAIVCPADRNMAAVKMSKKAAFFYIEGTFFIDKRSRATDLVKPIKQFCAQQGIPVPPEIGEDRAEAMPERMEDLEGGLHTSHTRCKLCFVLCGVLTSDADRPSQEQAPCICSPGDDSDFLVQLRQTWSLSLHLGSSRR